MAGVKGWSGAGVQSGGKLINETFRAGIRIVKSGEQMALQSMSEL